MAGDFYRALREVEQLVVGSSAYDERVDERAALDRALSTLAQSARGLADCLSSYPPPENPGILYDGCEGEWEETAFVPVRMASTAKAARQAIPAVAKEWVLEEAGFYLHCSRRCFLAPGEYSHGDEDWRYSHCRKGDVGAIEFWRVEIAERRFSPGRAASNLRLGIRAYRRQRKQGVGRWKATKSLRISFSPQLIRMARFRVKQWKARRARG